MEYLDWKNGLSSSSSKPSSCPTWYRKDFQSFDSSFHPWGIWVALFSARVLNSYYLHLMGLIWLGVGVGDGAANQSATGSTHPSGDQITSNSPSRRNSKPTCQLIHDQLGK